MFYSDTEMNGQKRKTKSQTLIIASKTTTLQNDYSTRIKYEL